MGSKGLTYHVCVRVGCDDGKVQVLPGACMAAVTLSLWDRTE